MIKGSTGGERLKCLDIMGLESQAEGIAISNAIRLEDVYLIGITSSEWARGVSSKKNQGRNGLSVPACSFKPGSANFFCEEPDGKRFPLCRPFGVCCSYATLLLQRESSQRQYINGWGFNKNLFTKPLS